MLIEKQINQWLPVQSQYDIVPNCKVAASDMGNNY